MPSPDVLREAARQMAVCNACRYCEGYCAVFPAMELRRTFAEGDLVYLANLCFECRACHAACPYTGSHEFRMNVPKALAELRVDTYRDYTWPRVLSKLFQRNGLGVALISAACVAAVLALTLALQGPSVLFSRHVGEGAFYSVIPYAAMALPSLAILLYALAALALGAVRFWRETGASPARLVSFRALAKATRDAFGLEYLKGGGQGCAYPDARFSHARRRLHHLVFYGFLLDLVSTTIAAAYHHFLEWEAPYPLLSWPVVTGTVGGVMLVAGTAGLLWLKARSDRSLAAPRMQGMDVAFLVLLFATSLTGLAVLAFRETAAMGTLLAVHLGAVAGLFLTLPYGKFAHAAYRYAALVRHSLEQSSS
jgi:citrate/tricarballylate utilization protein